MADERNTTQHLRVICGLLERALEEADAAGESLIGVLISEALEHSRQRDAER